MNKPYAAKSSPEVTPEGVSEEITPFLHVKWDKPKFEGVSMPTSEAPEKFCPHAHRCIHPCDDDECFLETIEHPEGPATPLTKEECDRIEAKMNAQPLFSCPACEAIVFITPDGTVVSHWNKEQEDCSGIAPLAPEGQRAASGVLRVTPCTWRNAYDGLEGIFKELQHDFHDQWNWFDAHFYLDILKAEIQDLQPEPAANTLSPQDEPLKDLKLECFGFLRSMDHFYGEEYVPEDSSAQTCITNIRRIINMPPVKGAAPKVVDSKEEQDDCKGPCGNVPNWFADQRAKVEEQDGVQEPSVEEIRAASGDHMEVPEGERGNFHIHGGKLYILESIAAQAVMRGEERLIAAENRTAKSVDVCCGDGVAAGGRPCICGGSGLSDDEKIGLRRAIIELEERLDSLSPSEPIRESVLREALRAVEGERLDLHEEYLSEHYKDSGDSDSSYSAAINDAEQAIASLLAKGSPSEEGTGGITFTATEEDIRMVANSSDQTRYLMAQMFLDACRQLKFLKAGWISAKQELPPEKQKVLAFRRGTYALGYREQLAGIVDAHWQPLPAPPVAPPIEEK